MNAILPLILAFIQDVLPLISGSSAASSSVVQMLIRIVPIVVQEATDLLPQVQNVIRVLSTKDGVTDEDMAALQALDQQCDDAFEAAVAAKDAEGNANG